MVVDVEVFVELSPLEVALHSFEHSYVINVLSERRNHLTFCPAVVLSEEPTEDRMDVLAVFRVVWSIKALLSVVSEGVSPILKEFSLLHEW